MGNTIRINRRAAHWLKRGAGIACLTAVTCLVGCAGGSGGGVGPDLVVAPQYRPTPQAAGGVGKNVAVAVKVVDARRDKGETRGDGREVIAEGDKGRVFVSRPVSRIVEDAMTAALRASGFAVDPAAPVTIELQLVEMPVQATQFTNWGLPSERASTLDALGAIVPGPVRETRAKAAMTVTIRKHDARLGFSHVVGGDADAKSTDSSVVEQTLAKAISGAVDEAVAKAGPDVEIVTRTPVSTKEIFEREEEFARQQKAIAELTEMLASRDQMLSDDRKALDDMRKRLVEDQRIASAAVTKARAEADSAVAAARAEAQSAIAAANASATTDAAARAKAVEDANARVKAAETAAAKAQADAAAAIAAAKVEVKPGTDPAAQAKLTDEANANINAAEAAATKAQAEATKAQSDAAAAIAAAKAGAQADAAMQAKAVEAANTKVKAAEALAAKAQADAQAAVQAEAAARKAIEDREKNLTAYAAKLKDQEQSNKTLADELAARHRDLSQREKVLTNWKADLQARADVKPPASIVEKRKPLILVTEPGAARSQTTLGHVTISGVAIDDRGFESVKISINGQPATDAMTAPAAAGKGVGIGIASGPVRTSPDKTPYAMRRFNVTAPLRDGENEILIEAVNSDRLQATEKFTVLHDKSRGRIHIIAIGINDYKNQKDVPPLQYAVADAKSIADTFTTLLVNSPDKRVMEVLDRQATRSNIMQELFEKLPTEVRPADTVVIFFSGHGAPDARTDEQGNVETFLLPADAEPDRLFATAIRMKDIATILRRLPSERIVFLADTCYSGGAKDPTKGGGLQARSVAIPGLALKGGIGIRAVPDRPRGKGCAILTATTGIEVAQEKNELKHGVFTHFLLAGLKGEADGNRDGQVTVDELYDFVRAKVNGATLGTQNPQISRDPSAGDIVLSVVGVK